MKCCDWSSDVCSSDLVLNRAIQIGCVLYRCGPRRCEYPRGQAHLGIAEQGVKLRQREFQEREIDGGAAGRETDGQQAATGEVVADATARGELGGSAQLPRDVAYPTGPAPGGTVGAVARDRQGRLAAATSTGGAPGKWPGRIGDSPVIGAGTFADDKTGACSATGWGESILRAALASAAVRQLHPILDFRIEGPGADPPPHPALAARAAILWFQQRVGGLGGVILLDRRGRVGWAFNTPRMSRGVWVQGQGEAIVGLDP
jgi:isoaspartyl peptidase/L-asparaginase-like protein (Ntn-hydrolase superfamily)